MPLSSVSFITTLVSALVALGLAAFVVRCNRRASANHWLALGLLVIAIHQTLVLASGFAPSESWHLVLLRSAFGVATAIPPIWLGFSLTFGDKNGGVRKSHRNPMLASATLVAVAVAIPLALGRGLHPISIGNTGHMVIGLDGWGKLLFSVYLVGLVLVLLHLENLYRYAAPPVRYKLTTLILGIFVALACQIVAASYSLLFGLIHPSHPLVSSTGFLGGQALIAFALVRHRLLDSSIYVSRYVIYRSLTLALVGGYLLSLGVVAEIFRRMAINLDFLTGTLLAIAGGAALALVLLSENIQWKVKGFIQAHFYRHKYDYREEWMEFTRHLSNATTAPAVAAQTAERILKVMWVRQVAIYTSAGQPEIMSLLHQIGYDHLPPTLTLSPNTLRMLVDTGNRLPSAGRREDTSEIRRDLKRELLPDAPVGHLVPLFALDSLVGLLVVGPEVSGKPFGVDDRDLVTAVAAQAGAMIVNARLAQEASEFREVQALSVLSTFIAHDLKNAVSMLSMLAENAKQHMAKPEFQADAIRTLGDVSARMRTLLAALAAPGGRADVHPQRIGFAGSIEAWLRDIGTQVPARVRIESRLDPTDEVRVDPNQLKSVLHNLVINAVEAIPGEGNILIETAQENGFAVMSVMDTGPGMTEEFVRQKLFRPFQSTKERGLGIGLYQCRHIVQAFGGTLTAESQEGKGTRMVVKLPTQDVSVQRSEVSTTTS